MVSEGWRATVEWFSKAAMDGVFGLALGMLLIPLVKQFIGPVWVRIKGGSNSAA